MSLKNRIVLYLLLLIVFLLIIFWGTGSLDSVKDLVSGAEEYAPDISTGLDELQAEETILDPGVKKQAKALKETINAMMNSSKSQCFQRFGGFKEDLGEDEENTVSFLFTFDPMINGTTITIKNYKETIYDRFDVPSMIPCVIAGPDESYAESFVDKYLDGKDVTVKYSQVQAVNIYYNTEDMNGNVLRVVDPRWPTDKDPVNDEGDNYESDGILYKADKNTICFIPTIYGTYDNADQDGINNDYVDDTSDEGTIAWKVANGHIDTPKCSAINGYEAIELFEDNDASTGEFDCDYKRRKDAKKHVRNFIEQFVNYKSEDNDCTATFEKYMSTDGVFRTADNGCWAIISEDDDGSYNDCGWVEVSSGEMIPSYDSGKSVKLKLQGAPRYEETDALCVAEFFSWSGPLSYRESALICDGSSHKWFLCDETTLGVEKNMPVNGQNASYVCKKEGNLFTWNNNETQNLPWFVYQSLELFADNDEDYPGDCDTDNVLPYFACPVDGTPGVSKNADFGSGFYPCPTQDYDCNEFAKSNKAKITGDKGGCNLFLSEEDTGTRGSNDCATAVVPYGEYVNHNYGSFYNCGTDDKCDEGPIFTKGDDNGLCLLKNNWANMNYPGEFICNTDQNWYLCEERKEGSCLNIQGKEYCCKTEDGTNYIFKKIT